MLPLIQRALGTTSRFGTFHPGRSIMVPQADGDSLRPCVPFFTLHPSGQRTSIAGQRFVNFHETLAPTYHALKATAIPGRVSIPGTHGISMRVYTLGGTTFYFGNRQLNVDHKSEFTHSQVACFDNTRTHPDTLKQYECFTQSTNTHELCYIMRIQASITTALLAATFDFSHNDTSDNAATDILKRLAYFLDAPGTHWTDNAAQAATGPVLGVQRQVPVAAPDNAKIHTLTTTKIEDAHRLSATLPAALSLTLSTAPGISTVGLNLSTQNCLPGNPALLSLLDLIQMAGSLRGRATRPVVP